MHSSRSRTSTSFSRSWVFAGFVHELARAGDAFPVTVAGQPVLLVCDAQERVRAFHNVCRHRCLKLVDTPRNVGRTIRCPYHSWTYGLDGTLHIAPYFGGRNPRATPEGFDRGRHGLAPVRAEKWHDWIFVNLNGAAPPLEDFIAPLRKRLDGLDLTRLHHLVTIDFGEIAANWKLLVENFIEPYHVQFVHSTTTEQPLADHYTINDPGCLGCGVDVSGDATRKDTLSQDSRFLTLFPNFVLGAYLPDQIGVHLEVPVAPDRTLQRRAIYSLKSEPEPARRGSSSRSCGARCTVRTTPCSSGFNKGARPRWRPAAACSLRCGKFRCGAFRSSWSNTCDEPGVATRQRELHQMQGVRGENTPRHRRRGEPRHEMDWGLYRKLPQPL